MLPWLSKSLRLCGVYGKKLSPVSPSFCAFSDRDDLFNHQ